MDVAEQSVAEHCTHAGFWLLLQKSEQRVHRVGPPPIVVEHGAI